MNNNAVIQTHSLTRYFGQKCAVDQVSMIVPKGSVFAMLGRNGSGKSTFIQLLLGLIQPTFGSAEIFGISSHALSTDILARIGYVPEGHPLPGFFKVQDIHAFQRSYYPQWNEKLFRTLIDHFGLSSKQRVSQLSRGQKAGLALSLAMAPEPSLLIMDDPALGLDPVARRTLLEAMILNTRNAGNTIFFTSHELADVERVADHIAILDRSAMRVCCSLETFRNRVKQINIFLNGHVLTNLPKIPGLLRAVRHGKQLILTIANPSDETRRIVSTISSTFTESSPTLEDAAIGYLGERGQQISLLDSIELNVEVA